MTYAGHDTSLANSAQLTLQSGRVEFQFPPRVLNDGRKGNWKEGELRGVEPIAVFATSGPRVITIGWTYIIDGGAWDARRVADNVKRLRGYFAQIRGVGADTRKLIAKLKLWQVGGNKPISCRLVDIGVKYGETIVGSGDDAYYLRTDITLDIRLWTKGTAGEEVINLPDMDAIVTEDWY